MTDGLSHTDYTLLMSTLGETYAERVVSAEHLILDYLAGRIAEEIEKVWRAAAETRQILFDNISAGRTAGETLDLLIEKIEKAGYYYNPIDQFDPTADPTKTQVHLDLHAEGRSGLVAPRISPLGSDWEREMTIPVLHTFTFEYMIHMPVPEWGEGKHIYIAFHDGAVVTEDGVAFPYPPDQGIRLIGPPAEERP